MQNKEYSLWKCETITFNVTSSFNTEQDAAVYMESAYGVTRFVSGLRYEYCESIVHGVPIFVVLWVGQTTKFGFG